MSQTLRNQAIFAAVIAILAVVYAHNAKAQSMHLQADSGTMQTRLNHQWDVDHPTLAKDNQHVAVAERDRTPGRTMSCTFTPGPGRIVQVSDCH